MWFRAWVVAGPVASRLEASARDGGLDHDVASGESPNGPNRPDRPIGVPGRWPRQHGATASAPWPPRGGQVDQVKVILVLVPAEGGRRVDHRRHRRGGIRPGQEFSGMVDVVPGPVGHHQVEVAPGHAGIGPHLGGDDQAEFVQGPAQQGPVGAEVGVAGRHRHGQAGTARGHYPTRGKWQAT